jgi:predicted ATPase
MADRTAHLLGHGNYEAAEAVARRQLAIDDLREKAHRQLMEALARGGRRRAALQQYETVRGLLLEELGIDPSTETQAMAESIRQDELGRRIELESPEPAELRPPVKLDLPAQATPFIGREREMAEVKALLETARLVTLTGPGGTGKTRLALQVAGSMADQYADGVTFVSLAATNDPGLVPNVIAEKLGVVEQPTRPLAESLQRYLRDKQQMLVLDSFEHLLEAAPLVSDLLAAASRLSVMATSREVLRLNGEYEHVVPPMTVPEPEHAGSVSELSGYESVTLFTERARAATSGFRLTEENASGIAGICIRLDGLPLAIELAAARIKLFNPQHLLSRLESRLGLLTGGPRDLPDRQRTLRDTIDWSYDLLEEGERQLFARLVVFTGGWSLEAAEAVCALGLSIDVLDGLESLLNKSLLYQAEGPGGETRFIMLETIHEYARERLAASGEEQLIKNRHLAFFLSLAEEAEPHLLGSEQVTWLNRLESEHNNLRTALEWSQTEKDSAELNLRLAWSLTDFWNYRQHHREGRQRLRDALSGEEAARPTAVRAKALCALGSMAFAQGDYTAARPLLEDSLSMYRELGLRDTLEFANALRMLGLTELHTGDYHRSADLLEESLAIFRELHDANGIARIRWHLGVRAMHTGDNESASQHLTEALTLYRRIGSKTITTYVLHVSADVAMREGDYGRATALLEESLALGRETGDGFGTSGSFLLSGRLALLQGQLKDAKTLLSQSLTLYHELGILLGITWCLDIMAELALAGAKAMTSLDRQKDVGRAVRLFAAAASLRQPSGMVVAEVDRPAYEHQLEELRVELGEAGYESAWAEGQAMSMDQAVAYALGE